MMSLQTLSGVRQTSLIWGLPMVTRQNRAISEFR